MRLIFLKKYIDYQTALSWFNDIRCVDNFVKNDKDCNDIERIFVLEHNNVYTAGKSVGNVLKEDIKKEDYVFNNSRQTIHGVPVFYTERGGLWTWHGHGQVVVYFIYNLRARDIDLSKFMSIIEDTVINSINLEIKRITTKFPKYINLEFYADSKKRGFWVRNINKSNCNKVSKFGFIGLKVTNGFVYHGISINYTNDLSFFDYINPCGLGDVEITSIEKLTKNNIVSSLDINFFKRQVGNDLFENLNKENINK